MRRFDSHADELRPVDAVTLGQAAVILGCSTNTVRKRVLAGALHGYGRPLALSRAEVEQLAAEEYPWRHHVHDPDSFWVTGGDAAAVLGVHRSRLGQLVEQDRLPYVTHRDGVRLYRRAQLEVLARR